MSYLKKASIAILFLLGGNLLLSAANRDGKENNDIGIIAGFNFPMYKDSGEGVVAGLTYSNWANSGLGFRIGVQHISNVIKVDNVVGAPVAVVYRTKNRNEQSRFAEGMNSARKSATGYRYDDNDVDVRNAFFSFLIGLFSNAEFYAGVTPGYIFGNDSPIRSTISWTSGGKTNWENSWTEVNYRFSTSLDAGANLNYGIWRFDLKLMPAFHFNITDNFTIHSSKGDSTRGETSSATQHARWFFSITGGLTFRF